MSFQAQLENLESDQVEDLVTAFRRFLAQHVSDAESVTASEGKGDEVTLTDEQLTDAFGIDIGLPHDVATSYAGWLKGHLGQTEDGKAIFDQPAHKRLGDAWAVGFANSLGKDNFSWSKATRGHVVTTGELHLLLADEVGKFHPDYDGPVTEGDGEAVVSDADDAEPAVTEGDDGVIDLTGSAPKRQATSKAGSDKTKAESLDKKATGRLEAATDLLSEAEQDIRLPLGNGKAVVVTLPTNPVSWVRTKGDERFLKRSGIDNTRRDVITAAVFAAIGKADGTWGDWDADEVSMRIGKALGLTAKYPHAMSGYRKSRAWLAAAHQELAS